MDKKYVVSNLKGNTLRVHLILLQSQEIILNMANKTLTKMSKKEKEEFRLREAFEGIKAC